MATRKKATGKAKAKRKKTPRTRAAARRKTTTVRKNRTSRPKAAKKAPPRRASPKKARPTAKAGVKQTVMSPPAHPEVARPSPSRPAQTAPQEDRIGVVTHYYSHLSVATIRLESGTLHAGDVIHIRGHSTDFTQKVDSLEVNHAPATEVGPNDDFGLKVLEHAREHDLVFKVRS
jgi:Elongation factor Tu domain 2